MKPYLSKWLNKPVILLAIGASIFCNVTAQQQYAFSAEESVQYAMKNTAQVKNALLAIQIQRQTNREITAAAYPQINGSLNYNNFIDIPTNLIPGEFFGQQPGTFVPVQFGTKHNTTYGVDLKQLLFDGQVFVGLQARKTSMDYAQKGFEVTQEQIKANVYKVYYQVLAGRQQLKTIDANIVRIDRLLNDTREIFKNGFAEKLDVDKVEVTLTNLKTEKLRVQNQLQVALQGLKLLMGMPVQDQLVLTDTLPEESLKEGLADITYSHNDRKEFQQVSLLEKLNEYNIRRYKLSYIPTLSITGSYNRNAQRNSFNFFKGGEPWFKTTIVGLSISVPIFDGFARDARIKRAQLELEQIQNNKQNLRLAIDNEVEQARLNLRSSVASMDYQRKNMQLAEMIYEQTKKKFEAGLGSNLEITTAQTELTTAQNNYYSALYDAIVARIDYLRATGKL
jgi:outer membrane protein